MQAVPTAQREKLFNTYMQAVTQLQQAAQERATRARAGFQVPFLYSSPLVHQVCKPLRL
jgi:hypothetical protein